MNNMETLIKIKSSGKVLKTYLNPFQTVKEIISEKLLPDLAVASRIDRFKF